MVGELKLAAGILAMLCGVVGCSVPMLSFPALDRLEAAGEALSFEARQPLLRISDEGTRLARWDASGRFFAADGFAPSPWTTQDLGFALGAILGRPLALQGATLSFDSNRPDRLVATDGSGRVVELHWKDAQALPDRLILCAGFDARLPREWSLRYPEPGQLEVLAPRTETLRIAWSER